MEALRRGERGRRGAGPPEPGGFWRQGWGQYLLGALSLPCAVASFQLGFFWGGKIKLPCPYAPRATFHPLAMTVSLSFIIFFSCFLIAKGDCSTHRAKADDLWLGRWFWPHLKQCGAPLATAESRGGEWAAGSVPLFAQLEEARPQPAQGPHFIPGTESTNFQQRS